jgi:Lon protease-like protein
LQVVVFPRTRLPLHIFEERYKLMVGEAIRDECEFGIVLARDRALPEAGCSVAVEKVIESLPRWAHGHSDARPKALRNRIAR